MSKRRRRAKGAGYVHYNKARRKWEARFIDANGQRVKRVIADCVGEKQAITALDALVKAEKRKASRKGALSNEVELKEVIEQYLSALSISATVKHVRDAEQKMRSPIEMQGFFLVSDFTPLKIERFRASRLKQTRRNNLLSDCSGLGCVSRSTVNKEVAALKSCLKWAEEHNIIERNPMACIRPLPIKKHERAKRRRSLTPEEVAKLLDPKNSINGLDLIIATFLGTGLRRGELAELTWGDLNLESETPTITVRSEVSKNGDEAILPVPQPLAKRLQQYRAQVERRSRFRRQVMPDRVFMSRKGGSIYGTLLRRFYGAVKRSGIDPTGVDLHSLRKTYVSELARKGVPVKVAQQLARHKSITVTLDIYAEVFPCDLVDGIKTLSWFDDGVKQTQQTPQAMSNAG